MKLKELFFSFFKIGLFTIGGGYAMIPVIQKTMVDELRVMTKEEFIDAMAVSQSAPGAIAINMSVYVGYKIRGIKGALVSAIGTILPSFLMILFISMFFFKVREVPIIEKIFKGIRAAIVAMIGMSFVELVRSVDFKIGEYIMMGTCIAVLIIFRINPVWVLLASGVFSITYYGIKGNDAK